MESVKWTKRQSPGLRAIELRAPRCRFANPLGPAPPSAPTTHPGIRRVILLIDGVPEAYSILAARPTRGPASARPQFKPARSVMMVRAEARPSEIG